MFESAELGHAIPKAAYRREEPRLRQALLEAQYAILEKAMFPVVVLVGGVDGAGKSETLQKLTEWMDPRHVQAHGIAEPSDEVRERPHMWRFWRALPPKGKTAVFVGSWYTEPIVRRVEGDMKDASFDAHLEQIVAFEKMLTDEGALLVKFWFHLSKKVQKRRLKELEADKKTRWRVTKEDWRRFEEYEHFRTVSERALRETSRNEALWTVIEGTDERYRELTFGRALLARMKAHLERFTPRGKRAAASRPGSAPLDVLPVLPAIDRKRVVSSIDLSKRLSEREYDDGLERQQRRLALLRREPAFRKRSAVVVFEGVDAAGKGGAIRRVTQALDPVHYQVVPIAAPTEEERAQPYLWRFWRHLPRRGRFTIFDRSWYGRVLVERVEGYAVAKDWTRAYAEINDFEEQMSRHGTLVVKFWLQISKTEQMRRFRERQEIGFKRFKIGPDDWRNRGKWSGYESAVCDMVDRTSTEIAPWSLIPAEDKRYARVEVLTTLCDRLEAAL